MACAGFAVGWGGGVSDCGDAEVKTMPDAVRNKMVLRNEACVSEGIGPHCSVVRGGGLRPSGFEGIAERRDPLFRILSTHVESRAWCWCIQQGVASLSRGSAGWG